MKLNTKKGKTNTPISISMDIQAHNQAMPTNNNESQNGHSVNGRSSKAQNRKPKLDDGFFEIEAVRHKRVRKGEVQYLIKWRGWPESANTWEPVWNLQSCTFLITAFEESLVSGKQRKRKGMNKDTITNSQSKKKQQLSSSTAVQRKRGQTSGSANESNVMDRAGSAPVGPSNGGIESSEMTNSGHNKKREENGHSLAHGVLAKVNEQNGNEHPASNDGIPEANGAKPGSKGSGRRKPKSVKRFKKDSNEPDVNLGAGTQKRRGPVSPGSVNPSQRTGDIRAASTFTEIIRAVSFTASVSNNNQDVDVNFMAKRSDGAETMVTNKYLKDHNPLLLIDFYERNLKYSPTAPLT